MSSPSLVYRGASKIRLSSVRRLSSASTESGLTIVPSASDTAPSTEETMSSEWFTVAYLMILMLCVCIKRRFDAL